MSCGVDCRRGSDPVLLWFWPRPAATAPIGPLAWESPYAAEVALEVAKRQKKKNSQQNTEGIHLITIRGMYDKPIANIILSDERLNDFPLRSGTR